MTALELFRQAERLDKTIDDKISYLSWFQKTSDGLRASGFEMNYNASPSTQAPFVSLIEKIDELNAEINADIDTLVNLKTRIRQVIDGVENPEEQKILQLRHTEGLTTSEISLKMHYTKRWIQILYRRALVSADAVLAAIEA